MHNTASSQGQTVSAVGDADIMLFLTPKYVRTCFSRGNKHDPIKSLTRSAEWSQFAVDYFCGNLT